MNVQTDARTARAGRYGGIFLKIAVCDDDRYDLKSEADMVESVCEELGIDFEINTFMSAESLLMSGDSYDMIFLDVEMIGMNGLQAAELIHRRSDESIIFVATAYNNYMDEAFNKHAFRFWPKPIERNKVAYGIESALKEMAERKRYLTVTVNKKRTHVLVDNIIYAYTENRVSRIVTTAGDIETREPFKGIKEALEKKSFCEVHASYCVNMRYVVDFTQDCVICAYNGKVYNVEISRRKIQKFKEKFTEWVGGTI